MGGFEGFWYTLKADHYSVSFQYDKQVINKRRGASSRGLSTTWTYVWWNEENHEKYLDKYFQLMCQLNALKSDASGVTSFQHVIKSKSNTVNPA